MYMPRVQGEQTSKNVQIEFRGYNHNLFVQENEFYDEQNMFSEYYPVLSPREKFWKYLDTTGETPKNFDRLYDFLPPVDGDSQAVIIEEERTPGLHYGDMVVRYNGDALGYIDGWDQDDTYMVEMGAYVCIFPQKVMFNREDESPTLESMEVRNVSSKTSPYSGTHTVGFWLCDASGNRLNNVTVSNTEPSNPNDGAWWVDTSGASEPGDVDKHVLKQWSASLNMWITQTHAYTKICALGIGEGITAGDVVTLSEITDTTSVALTHLNGDWEIKKVTYSESTGAYGLIIEALIDYRAYYVTGDDKRIKVERLLPFSHGSYVCEHENRLWCCDRTKNEIFASKLGDPKSWKSYAGISTDSYAVSVGSPGFFTGCISYGGAVNFFKPHEIIRISGSKPSNFQTRSLDVPGVAGRAWRSLCVINELLYYISEFGVYSFDGYTPRRISDNLGPYLLGRGGIRDGATGYTGQGGTDGKHYYIYTHMQNKHDGTDWSKGKYGLFVYDPDTGIWSKIREYTPAENIWIRNFKKDPNHLNVFFMTDNDIYSVWNSLGYLVYNEITAVRDEEDIEWSAETGDIAYYDTNRRYISKIQIRTELEQGSILKVALQYDHGPWEDVYTQNAPDEASARKTYLIPIIPHRCDTVRMKFYGTGGCKIFAVSKHYEQGSEI